MSAASRQVRPAAVADDPVARARAVAPLISAAAGRIEHDRALPADLLAAIHDARLVRALLPRAIGGDEATPETYCRMMEVIAAADASTAWCIGQASGCSMAAAYVAPEVARRIWGPADASLAWGAVGPDQVAEVVDGGYRVTGTWQFASGGRHATWFGGHCRVRERDGTMRTNADGSPHERTMLFPREAISMTEAWQVIGLRGTGSDTYSVTGLFVPQAFTVRRDRDEERQALGHGPLYRFTTTHLYASGFASVALGIARGMLDSFVALANAKTPWSTTRMLRDSPVLQSGLAQAEGRWRAARAGLHQALRDSWDDVAAGHAMTTDQKVAIRLASTFATHQAKEVADFAWAEAGATAIFESQPFERRFRDIHAVTQQIQARRTHFETVGQHLMGLTPHPRFL
ncbi:acyl-CoA dehydrogenase family protein [Roseomonas sp. CECT 9278]|uniref:acyl-CoA dehydrogenase family protein n=1 Tax=Roseomonas sp. CECT 9278 TaxID=2845823 RepID=UPI001E508556|nr:acyl-CoA dehydrogenase family protein [Roseomonas sp. CECT 9278]CAH0237609.1 Flavin-dependent monooxygenase, oxygenase subunit HsaA [Roseomonas sp. CECT 9278]